jgi:uncharacterized protein (TIGR02271 family)
VSESRKREQRRRRGGDHAPASLVSHEEAIAGVEKRWRSIGSLRARKRLERERVRRSLPVEVEHVELERLAAAGDDSGEVEVLPDGSISIPVYEEELVVTRRPVLRERVIVRKKAVTEHVTIEDELRKERVEFDADDEIDWIDTESVAPRSRPEPADHEREPAGRGRREEVIRAGDRARPWFDYELPRASGSVPLGAVLAIVAAAVLVVAVAALSGVIVPAWAWILLGLVVAASVLGYALARAGPRPRSRAR